MADTEGSVDALSEATNGGDAVTPCITHVILDLDGTLLDTGEIHATLTQASPRRGSE